jgi:hypothetical protein
VSVSDWKFRPITPLIGAGLIDAEHWMAISR